jgi:hypothetical protein
VFYNYEEKKAMTKKIPPSLSKVFTILALTTASLSVNAGTIPNPAIGVENPILYSFTSVNDGAIGAYFFGGASAAYTNELTMIVNGVASGIQGLNNHSSAYGDFLNLGNVFAGDKIVFEMVNLNWMGIGPWFSDKSLNSDGINHVYSTSFDGDSIIPAGTYLSFEDLNDGGDFNYSDLSFVITNVSAKVSEPSDLGLFLIASLMLMTVSPRKKAYC